MKQREQTLTASGRWEGSPHSSLAAALRSSGTAPCLVITVELSLVPLAQVSQPKVMRLKKLTPSLASLRNVGSVGMGELLS